MTSRTLALDESLHDYLLAIGVSEHPVLRELRDATASLRFAKMQIAPEQGQFMGWLARLTGVRRYLEIGVFTGYSTLAVALAMPDDGRVVACDVRADFTAIGRAHWEKAGVADRIDLRLGLALDTLKGLLDEGRAGEFDLAFIDADKPSYPAYLDACARLVRKGGIIAVDNIFLSGRVVTPQADDPPSVQLMHDFNAALKQDPRFDLCVLPLGDGVTLLIRR